MYPDFLCVTVDGSWIKSYVQIVSGMRAARVRVRAGKRKALFPSPVLLCLSQLTRKIARFEHALRHIPEPDLAGYICPR